MWAANAADVDIAEMLLDLEQASGVRNRPSSRPSLAGWDSLKADLTEIIDLLTLQVTQGNKWKPRPRPESAMEIVKRERKDKKMSVVEAQLVGS